MRDVQETREAQREWKRESKYVLRGPPVKKSDFLKTTAIPTGPGPKPVLPFERVDLRRITNAIDTSLQNAKQSTLFDSLPYYWRF